MKLTICGVYNRVDVLHGVHNISPILHMGGEILHTPRKISPVLYGGNFAWGYAKFLLYSMGKQHGVGVRYINHSIPIYIYRRFCVGVRKISPI